MATVAWPLGKRSSPRSGLRRLRRSVRSRDHDHRCECRARPSEQERDHHQPAAEQHQRADRDRLDQAFARRLHRGDVPPGRRRPQDLGVPLGATRGVEGEQEDGRGEHDAEAGVDEKRSPHRDSQAAIIGAWPTGSRRWSSSASASTRAPTRSTRSSRCGETSAATAAARGSGSKASPTPSSPPGPSGRSCTTWARMPPPVSPSSTTRSTLRAASSSRPSPVASTSAI